jgi:hypothetical protein
VLTKWRVKEALGKKSGEERVSSQCADDFLGMQLARSIA